MLIRESTVQRPDLTQTVHIVSWVREDGGEVWGGGKSGTCYGRKDDSEDGE